MKIKARVKDNKRNFNAIVRTDVLESEIDTFNEAIDTYNNYEETIDVIEHCLPYVVNMKNVKQLYLDGIMEVYNGL